MTQRKILHAADIHLDSPLQKLGSYQDAPAEQIRGASRRALENMTRLAIRSQVDLVVIAGDLYDGDWRDQNTGLYFVSQAKKLVEAGIPLVVIRGNHDAANVMTSTLPLPKNPDGSEIMMAADRVDCRVFESLGIAVHGRSFGRREETEGLAQQYPAPHRGMFNLGLLHTSLNGTSGHDRYAPCTPSQLTDKEYNYWALGHIHARGEHGLPGGCPIVFSGNIQGRHIRECGEKGCLIVNVDSRDQVTTDFHVLDVVRWQMCDLDVSSIQHADDVGDLFQRWLVEKLDQVGDRMLVARVQLTGQSRLHGELHRRVRQIESDLRSLSITHGEDRTWLEKVVVKTSIPVDQVSHEELQGPIESLLHVVGELSQHQTLSDTIQSELSSLARKLPTELVAAEGTLDFESAEWSKSLIDAASADILSRIRACKTSSEATE